MPKLTIDLNKIRENTRVISLLAKGSGLRLMAVTKAVQGHPEVAKSMIEGGADCLGDSRAENILKLKKTGFENLSLLRQPSVEEMPLIAGKGLNFFISTVNAAGALSEFAAASGKNEKVTAMLETGDCREGFLASEFKESIDKIRSLPGIELKGIATNIACAQKVRSGLNQIEFLVKQAKFFEPDIEVSGANSSSISLLEQNIMPGGVTEIRIGEAILLGRETINFKPVKECHQDAFVFEAEVLEDRHKCGRRQFVLDFGRQDIGSGKVIPHGFRGKIRKSTSDHTMIETEEEKAFSKKMSFIPDYYGLVSLMASRYVDKIFTG